MKTDFFSKPLIGPNTFKDLMALFMAEVIGTFMLLFILFGTLTGEFAGNPSYLYISLATGFAVMTAVHTFAQVQAGHLNPCVTIGAMIVGHTDWRLSPIYFLAQFIGAFAGVGGIILLTPREYTRHIGSPNINPSIALWQGLGMEFIATGILIIACCAVWDRKHADKHDSVSLRLGLVVTAVVLVAIPYTGCNINPARSFAPAVINNDWKDHWVYWVGPISGSIVFSVLHRFLFQTPPPLENF